VAFAAPRAKAFAAGIKVGILFPSVASCRENGQSHRRFSLIVRCASRVCMQRKIIVSRAQLSGTNMRSVATGLVNSIHESARSQAKGRVQPGRPSVMTVVSRAIVLDPAGYRVA